jgi:diamine N-acetyltransferase
MAVTLREVTKENFSECIKLKPRDDQVNFVAPNVYSIAQSKFYPETKIRAIYAGDTMVGFVMWGVDADENPTELWVWRLMIDAAHQGHGYGHAAMEHIIATAKAAGHGALFLSYEPHNTGAARFYAKLGFEDTGRIEHDEIVVRLDLNKELDL